MEGDKNMERDSLWERAICLEKRVTALEEAHLRKSARRSSCETYKSDFRRSLENHGPFGSAVDGIGRVSSGYTGTFIENWSQPYGIARFEEFDREKAAIRLEMMAITEAANRFVEIARKEEADRLAEIARKEEVGRKRELDQKEKAAHLVEIARQDEAVRSEEANNIEANKKVTEEETRTKKKVDLTKSKDRFQQDMTQWINGMAVGSKHRTNWSEAHNPAVSKDIVNDFIVHPYGIFNSSKGQRDKAPRELIDLHAQFVKIQEKEPELLEQEGNLVDEEWMKLAKEREQWTSSRANMKLEDEMCLDEGTRYKQEYDYVGLEAEARQKEDRKALGANDEPFLQAFRKQDAESTQVTVEAVSQPSPGGNFTLTALPSGERLMFGGEYFDVDANACYNDVFKWNLDISTEKKMSKEAETLQGAAWKTICSLNPPPRCSHQAVLYREHLYIFGGEFATADQFHHYSDLWRLNLKPNAWEELEVKGGPSPRSGHRMVVWKNYLVVFAGLKWQKIVYSPFKQIPAERSGCQLDVHPSKDLVFVYGGYAKVNNAGEKAEGKVYADLWVLNLAPVLKKLSPIWEELSRKGQARRPRVGAALTAHKKRFILFDGVFEEEKRHHTMPSTPYNDRFVYDMDRRRWFEFRLRGNKSAASKRRRKEKIKACEKVTGDGDIDSDEVEDFDAMLEKQLGDLDDEGNIVYIEDAHEKEESLQHASTQLEGEIDSIHAFKKRMESEESALCNTIQTSLAKTSQMRRSEADLFEERVDDKVDQRHADRDEYCGNDQETQEVAASRDITKNEEQAWKRRVEVSQKLADGLKEKHVENAINLMEPRDRDKRQVMVFKQVWNVNEMSSIKVEGDFRSGYEADFITDAVDGRDAWRLKEVFPEFIVEKKTHIPLWIY